MSADNELLPDEKTLLNKLERIIRRADLCYVEKGKALREIKAKRLHRETHDNFANYCSEKWEMEKSHAYRLIDAFAIVEHLEEKGLPTPVNEGQVRELVRFKDDFAKAEKVWRTVVESGTQITAKVIAKACDDLYPEAPAAKGNNGGKIDEDATPGNSTAVGLNAPSVKQEGLPTYKAVVTAKASPEAIARLAEALHCPAPNSTVGNFDVTLPKDMCMAIFCELGNWVTNHMFESFSFSLE